MISLTAFFLQVINNIYYLQGFFKNAIGFSTLQLTLSLMRVPKTKQG